MASLSLMEYALLLSFGSVVRDIIDNGCTRLMKTRGVELDQVHGGDLKMKTLFKNGTIYDGTGRKPFKGDVLIEDDRIVEVAEKIRKKAQFKRWFCGHYHMDENLVVEGKNFQILYNKIERIY